ncbi:hypothetical protein V8C26DRAFT_151430 [Trichoderma gracile]
MARHRKPAHFELYGRQCEARPTPLLVCEYPPEAAVDTRKSSILLPCIQNEPARVSDSRTRAPSHQCFCCQILAFACSSPCCFSCCIALPPNTPLELCSKPVTMACSLCFLLSSLVCLFLRRSEGERGRQVEESSMAETLDPRGWLRAHMKMSRS